MTLVEVLFGSLLSGIIVTGASALLIASMSGWTKGAGKIHSQTQAQRAVRSVAAELREAMGVVIDAGGQGLTYRLPSKTMGGDFITPITWDNVVRRIEVSGTNLVVTDGTTTRVICRNYSTTDPATSSTYQIFTPGPGGVTRNLTVRVVTSVTDSSTAQKTRARETIFLRNVPDFQF